MTTWAVMLGVGIGSYVLRIAPLMLLRRAVLSHGVDRAIGHAGVAAIAGLIATSVRHTGDGTAASPTLLAVALGTVLAVRGTAMLRIIVAGATLYYGATLVVQTLG